MEKQQPEKQQQQQVTICHHLSGGGMIVNNHYEGDVPPMNELDESQDSEKPSGTSNPATNYTPYLVGFIVGTLFGQFGISLAFFVPAAIVLLVHKGWGWHRATRLKGNVDAD